MKHHNFLLTLTLAANLGALIPVAYINLRILLDGGIRLFEPNLAIIVFENVLIWILITVTAYFTWRKMHSA